VTADNTIGNSGSKTEILRNDETVRSGAGYVPVVFPELSVFNSSHPAIGTPNLGPVLSVEDFLNTVEDN
jgi:hypothetical protein